MAQQPWMRRFLNFPAAILMAALMTVACGGSPPSATAPSESPAAEPPPETAPTTAESTAVESQPLGTAKPESQAKDTTVIPGERVGAVTPTTTRADLAGLYGESALKDTSIDVGEGFTETGTIVWAGTDRQFTIIWSDESGSQPLRAMDFGPAWKTPEGLGVNSSFTDLKVALGDFQLYGFGWDYGGTVLVEGSKLDKYHGNIFLRAKPPENLAAANPEAYESVLGDSVFQGNNPSFEVLKPEVYAMEVYLNSISE